MNYGTVTQNKETENVYHQPSVQKVAIVMSLQNNANSRYETFEFGFELEGSHTQMSIHTMSKVQCSRWHP